MGVTRGDIELGKATIFKTYRLKAEKVLEWRQKQVNELLSKNMSL